VVIYARGCDLSNPPGVAAMPVRAFAEITE
jgi:hypothetical protein